MNKLNIKLRCMHDGDHQPNCNQDFQVTIVQFSTRIGARITRNIISVVQYFTKAFQLQYRNIHILIKRVGLPYQSCKKSPQYGGAPK